jgi:hypothetical protein
VCGQTDRRTRWAGGAHLSAQLPAEAVAATALIEVVRVSALPDRADVPCPGPTAAHRTGVEAADAPDLIAALPGGERHRRGFFPGRAVRAYDDTLELPLREAAFGFTCDEARAPGRAAPAGHTVPRPELTGGTVPPHAGPRGGAVTPGRHRAAAGRTAGPPGGPFVRTLSRPSPRAPAAAAPRRPR